MLPVGDARFSLVFRQRGHGDSILNPTRFIKQKEESTLSALLKKARRDSSSAFSSSSSQPMATVSTSRTLSQFYEYFENYDWLVILRHNDWIESGFQFIKINEKTKEFAKFYLDFFLSGRAFTQEPQWADNWILEACFRDYEGELTTGGLTPFFGCPIDINDYIRHSKAPLRQVRDKQKI